MTNTKSSRGKKVRRVIRGLVELGASPESIIFSVGRIVTPDERDYLLEYEKKYKEQQ